MGSLPDEVEEPAVEEYILDCESVVAVRIVTDQVTELGRGCDVCLSIQMLFILLGNEMILK